MYDIPIWVMPANDWMPDAGKAPSLSRWAGVSEMKCSLRATSQCHQDGCGSHCNQHEHDKTCAATTGTLLLDCNALGWRPIGIDTIALEVMSSILDPLREPRSKRLRILALKRNVKMTLVGPDKRIIRIIEDESVAGSCGVASNCEEANRPRPENTTAGPQFAIEPDQRVRIVPQVPSSLPARAGTGNVSSASRYSSGNLIPSSDSIRLISALCTHCSSGWMIDSTVSLRKQVVVVWRHAIVHGDIPALSDHPAVQPSKTAALPVSPR